MLLAIARSRTLSTIKCTAGTPTLSGVGGCNFRWSNFRIPGHLCSQFTAHVSLERGIHSDKLARVAGYSEV